MLVAACSVCCSSFWTSAFTPCRFPCVLKYLRAPFNIVMRSEPDGTPCKYMGHCSRGACLNIKNYTASGRLERGPSHAIRSNHNSIAGGNSHASDAPVLTSADYARSGFLSETNVIHHASQVISETAKGSRTSFFAQEPGARNELQRLLRVKRATRRSSDEERLDNRVIESGKYESLARFRRSRKKRKRNRNGGNSRRLYNDNTYFNGNMNKAGSGRYGPSYVPHNPSVIIVQTPNKKRRKGFSLLKAVAGGAAAGGVGAAAYKLLKGRKKNEHASSSPAEGAESKIPEPNKTDSKANASGTEATVTANTSETGIGASESAGKAKHAETVKIAGTETDVTNKSKGTEIDSTKNTITEETEKTKGNGTNATVETGTSKTDKTEHTETEKTKISGTGITVQTIGRGPNAIEKSQITGTEAAGGTGTDTTDKNADNSGSASPLLTPSVRTGATGGTKLQVSINNDGVVTHITVYTGHERHTA
ncbi:uncharacterized protein LOC119444551 isoform X7 [Dermacentor silvarum]|uniref:uncharacterized protein LOC119444551 isoform X7 n=1 Tax=Dermacentor silvarum TaxID=543639 RepID=UPI002100C31E|nr:uncharacterized protein LOC119444551 isoform X7 [Dermacentor silvarum]